MTSNTDDHRSVSDRIQADIKDIRNQYDSLSTSTSPPSTTSLEHLASLTRNLQLTFQSTSSSLPSHDQRILSESLTSLSQSISTSLSASRPRPKFSFSKKPLRTTTAAPAAAALTPPSPPQKDSTEPSRKGERITNPSPATAPSLSSLERCIVSFPFLCDGVATAHVRDARNCILVLGRVDGAVHLTGLTDCIVAVAARQFRLHGSKGTRVFLRCGSEPIIEDCEDVSFARLPGVLSAQGAAGAVDAWDRVQDFSWLGDGVNPHWRRIGEHEGVSDDTWKSVIDPDGMHDVETTLERFGLKSQP